MKSVRGEGNCGEVTTRRKEACEDVRIRRVLSPGHLLAKPHQAHTSLLPRTPTYGQSPCSRVRFVKFFNNPDNNDAVDIMAADKGGVNETVNEMEIWKTIR